MLIGYMRVSSNDERQSVSLQRDALIAAGVDPRHLGVSLDIENYCTLRLLFNQSLVLDKVPEYGKPAKYCSP